jgi:hypothetical protein
MKKKLPHFSGRMTAQGNVSHSDNGESCERSTNAPNDIMVEVNGENIGGKLIIHYNEITKHDVVSFFITSGQSDEARDWLEFTFVDPYKPSGVYK